MIWQRKKQAPALSCHLQDLRPADPAKAEAIAAGHYAFEHGVMNTGPYLPFGLPSPSAEWESDLHGFSWLRHFSAQPEDQDLANLARHFVRAWLAEEDWHNQAWTMPVTTRRVISWLTNGKILTENIGDGEWQIQLRKSLIRHGKFLLRRARAPHAHGDTQLSAAVAVALLGLTLPGYDHWLTRGFDLLTQEIHTQILPDGGHASRNPSEHLTVLFDLLTLKTNLAQQGRPGPDRLASAIDRMLPMLRFFRHGDGRLALFNGAMEEDNDSPQAALAHDDARGRPFAFAPHSGYQRLTVGRTLILMDVGTPPPGRYARAAHAGCLSLEMSSGKQRFLVNCGAAKAQNEEWRRATRTTAAHSTLTLQDTSSARLARRSGRVVEGPAQVDSHRNENQQGVWLEAGHDGYAKKFDLVHRRRLFLNRNGNELRGEDMLLPAPLRATYTRFGRSRKSSLQPKRFTVRFHFHPDVRVGVAHNGASMIARLPNGEGWRFKAQTHTAHGQTKMCHLQKQDSIYLGSSQRPRRSEQLVIEDQTLPQEARGGPDGVDIAAKINWIWQKIDKVA